MSDPAFTRIAFDVIRGPAAVKAAAYNLSNKLGEFDYSRKAADYVAGAVLLPPSAHERFADRETLWTELQAAERQQATGQPARQVLISIPRGVPQHLYLDLARAIAAPWVAAGMAAQLDIHAPIGSDGERQPHVHVMLSMRRLADNPAKTKARQWNNLYREDQGKAERARIADRANGFFCTHGLDITLDARSLADRGIDRPPEPIAPARDWQRWLREGAQPNAQPITVQSVMEHRIARKEWQTATAIAEEAETEAAAREKQNKRENARRLETGLNPQAPPGNNQQNFSRPAQTRSAAAADTREEATMARKPLQNRRSSPKTEPWMRHGGGFVGLSPRLQASAHNSYTEWAKAKPHLAAKVNLDHYVSYVQDKHAEEPDVEHDDREDDANSLSPANANQLNSIAPSSSASGDERRRTHLQAVLAERYKAPEALAQWCQRIEVDQGGGRAVLHGEGGRLIDGGDSIGFEGTTCSPELAAATVAMCRSHGWSSLRLSGTQRYKNAIASAAALAEPPIQTDHTLSKHAAEEVQDALRQRAAQAVPGLPDLAGFKPEQAAAFQIDRERSLTQAVLAAEPQGIRDPRAIASPQIAELVSRRDQAREDADEITAAANAHRLAHPWSARLLDGAVRRRQAALASEAERQAAEARRLERGHDSAVRRVEKASNKQALENTRQHEDFWWSPESRKARIKLGQLDALQAAVAAGNPAVVEPLAAGNWKQAQVALKTVREGQEAARLAALTPAQQRDAALRRLAENEHAAGADQKKMAEARVLTAAAVAGDPATIAAAARGDIARAMKAAEVFRKREAVEEAERRRERDRLLDAQQRLDAAQDAGYTGPT
jgi:hypothetical protein